ncbi:hypothetical protein AYO21_12047 [Fonsecaea monophora]|uniref:Uncharacterized protein n=1 Tax=Fonsecaea monophora TaxID=254056 RepID=A0A177ES12_9EURO|nr:hypothetical protein AYO21_12047 [Fonsecaea monophora]OAG33852.1 hypothetical protein AYO21_12047 [Fonsecaea monophora]
MTSKLVYLVAVQMSTGKNTHLDATTGRSCIVSLTTVVGKCGSGVYRFDYFSRIAIFVHRVPSSAHAAFLYEFYFQLRSKLNRLCAGDQEREQFGAQIIAHGSADVVGRTTFDKHQPDNYITHRAAPTCGLFLEFACSQHRNRLPELAEFYLLEAKRLTQMVIDIDCDSLRTKKVTLHTWRRGSEDHSDTNSGLIEYSQELRSENSVRVSGPPLRISVSDIVPREHVPLSLHNATIDFSVDELCGILETAEDQKTLVKAAEGEGGHQ